MKKVKRKVEGKSGRDQQDRLSNLDRGYRGCDGWKTRNNSVNYYNYVAMQY